MPATVADAQMAVDICRSCGATGLTLFADGVFLSAIEGDRAATQTVLNVITEHPRLTHCEILMDKALSKRHFDCYHIGFLRADFSADVPNAFAITEDKVSGFIAAATPEVQVLFKTFARINLGWPNVA